MRTLTSLTQVRGKSRSIFVHVHPAIPQGSAGEDRAGRKQIDMGPLRISRQTGFVLSRDVWHIREQGGDKETLRV
jgi:hypothetical protein